MAWRGFGAARAQGADERLLELDVRVRVDLEPGLCVGNLARNLSDGYAFDTEPHVGLERHHLQL